jgi:uncharacterized membrane protein
LFYLLLMAALIGLIAGIGLLINGTVLWGSVLTVGGVLLAVVLLVAYSGKRKKLDCPAGDLPCIDCGVGIVPDCGCGAGPDCDCGGPGWVRRVLSMSFVPCHRMPSRSLVFRGKHLPLCARCTAILVGYLAIPLLLAFHMMLPLSLGVLLQLPMIVDGFTQQWKWRESTNALRVATGLLSGLGQAVIVVTASFLLIDWLRGCG